MFYALSGSAFEARENKMATEREEHLEKMLSESMELGNRREKQLNDLITILQGILQYGGELRAVVQPAQPDPNAVRADKIQRLTFKQIPVK